MLATQKELAKILNISVRWVQQLQKDGVLYKDGDSNNYRLEDCVPAFVEYKVNSETGRKAAISKEQMQAEHEKVKMEISKLKLRRMRREVLDAASVERYWTDAVIKIRNKVMSLPSKIIIATSGEDVSHAIETATKICEEALDELADYDPELVASDVDYEEDGDEEDEDESEEER